MAITSVAFTDGRPAGYRRFEVINRPTADQRDIIWLYFEPLGFEREPIGDGTVEIDIVVSVSITSTAALEFVNEAISAEIYSGSSRRSKNADRTRTAKQYSAPACSGRT